MDNSDEIGHSTYVLIWDVPVYANISQPHSLQLLSYVPPLFPMQVRYLSSEMRRIVQFSLITVMNGPIRGLDGVWKVKGWKWEGVAVGFRTSFTREKS